MAWTTPKINWEDGDFFNVADYDLIKDDVALLKTLIGSLYVDYTGTTLESVTVNSIPTAQFFNNIAKAVTELRDNSIRAHEWIELRQNYVANKPAWSATDLNNIGRDLRLLYKLLDQQKSSAKKLSFKLGGETF